MNNAVDTASRHTEIPLSGIDVSHMVYGNYIGISYVFKMGLDSAALTQAWAAIQEQFSALYSVYGESQQALLPGDAPTEPIFKTSKLTYSELMQKVTADAQRKTLVSEPSRKSTLKGKAPMATLTITNLADRGSAIGLAISHAVTDAGGFHRVARHLADIYNAVVSGEVIPTPNFVTSLREFQFGTHRNWTDTQEELGHQNLPIPFSLTGVKGWVMTRLTHWGMNKILAQGRLYLHLSPDQITKLKATCLAESGENWISTNAALCAHFSHVMIRLINGENYEKSVQMAQLLDLRNRYFEDPEGFQDRFIGNAILIQTAKADLGDYSRANLTRFFKEMASGLDARFLKKRLDVISDCLRLGRTYPGLDMKTPMVAVNNQTKMPVYDLAFGGQPPARVIPQDVGDNIMFFPAADGGVEVYIRDVFNVERQEKLATDEWQAILFDF